MPTFYFPFTPFFMADAKKEAAMAQTGSKPVHTIRFRGISASIFENKTTVDGREVTFRKVSVTRSYKDGDDWKHTTSFGRDDLPVVNLVVQRAYEWILDTEAKSGKEVEA